MTDHPIAPSAEQTSATRDSETREKDPVERLIELLAIDPVTIAFATSAAALIVALAVRGAGADGLWCAIAAIVTQFVCLGLLTLHRRTVLHTGGAKPDSDVALAEP